MTARREEQQLVELVVSEIEGWAEAIPRRESHRSVAIVGASLLEATLEHLLKARLIHHPKIDLFGRNGPLSTFSAKIDMAHAAGIIAADIWDEVHRVRKIRNHFAHAVRIRSFNENTIRQHCANLGAPDLFEEEFKAADLEMSPEERYLLTCGFLAGLLGTCNVEPVTGVTRNADALKRMVRIPIRKVLTRMVARARTKRLRA